MLNIAVLGCGNISDLFIQASHHVSEVKVVAVYNRNLIKAQAFAESHHIKMAFSDYDEMLKQDSIDIIYIGLPNSLHFETAKKALEYGKMVIIEKPILSNMAEFNELLELSKEKDTKLFEMSRVLQLPNYKLIKKRIGDIAPVRMITINFSQYSRRYKDYLDGKDPNVFSRDFSGGALMDLGVYGIHFVVGLFGSPKDCVYMAQMLPNGIDSGGTLILKYDGFQACLVHSKNTKCDNRISIQGELGTIYAFPTASNLDKVMIDINEKIDLSVPNEYESMVYTLQDIVTIIKTDDSVKYLNRIDHSKMVLEVLDKARKSAGIIFKADVR
jgi:predicted dehydrogenase